MADEDVSALTADELEALELTGRLAGALRRIIVNTPLAANRASIEGDWAEVAHHIHVLQRYIGAQAAARMYPDKFRLLGSEIRR